MSNDPSQGRRLVFAITAHGLGHLTRSCELANALAEISPEIDFHFWTQLPRERIALDLEMPFSYRSSAYEPGTAQRNCFEIDAEETVRGYQAYLGERGARLTEERDALIEARCDAVICDVPALAIRAASDLGLPTIAVSNFTWDWVLEPILVDTIAEPVLDLLRDDYRQGTHQIRLPFGPVDSPFRSTEAGALVSRRARLEPIEVRRLLGMSEGGHKPLVLVCPGGWDATDWQRVSPDTRGFDLILVGDLPVDLKRNDLSLGHALRSPIRFPDLVRAADVVLAKPGYGIASECATNQTPMVTIDRPGFRETPLLRAEFARMGPSAEISLVDFFAGDWSAGLEEALGCSRAWTELPRLPAMDVACQVLAALGWNEGPENASRLEARLDPATRSDAS